MLISVVSMSCLKSKKPGIPEPVRKVIGLSGLNKAEFLTPMVLFEAAKDSLKLKSLYYLIANMGGHYEITWQIQDSTGKAYSFPINDYPDYKTLKRHLRLLREKVGELKVVHDSIFLDVKTVKAGLLTQNIDTAFKYWQHPVYKRHIYSFDDYCNFILPYRVANEKAEPFRSYMTAKYGESIFSVFNDTKIDLISLVGRIHQVVTGDIRYDKRFELHYDYPTLSEIANAHRGNFRDIAIYEVKVFRSFGVASTMDYCPWFADSSDGYFWPVVLMPNHHFIPVFYPGISVDNLTTPGKLPKVYRRKYSDDSTSLFRVKKIKEHTPAFLGQFNYDDVTDEYVETADVSVSLTDTARYAYLAVFNNGRWHPVQWSLAGNKTKTKFVKMGVDIVYLPMIVRKEQTIAAGLPFLLQKDGNTTVLNGKTDTKRIQANLIETAFRQALRPNKKYFLYQWKNRGWEVTRLLTANSKGNISVVLKPQTLYLLSKENRADRFSAERPFIITNGKIVFY